MDVKGFSDEFYRKLAKISHWRGILDVAKRAKEKWNMHVEVVTNIIPAMNDDDEQLDGIARWIADDLGELTPWHVTRFYPQHELQNVPATPVCHHRTCRRHRQEGRAEVHLRRQRAGPLVGKHRLLQLRQADRAAGTATRPRCWAWTVRSATFCGVELNFRTDLEGVPK